VVADTVVQHGDNLMRRKRKQIKGRKQWEEKKEKGFVTVSKQIQRRGHVTDKFTLTMPH
jgi:hypothetical protein